MADYTPRDWRNEAQYLRAERDRLREAIREWTFDHGEDGPCSCVLCRALAGPGSEGE